MEIAWLEVTDSPTSWSDVGFTVDGAGSCIVNGVEHRLVGAPADEGPRGIVRWGVRDIPGDVADIDGIPTVSVAEPGPATPAPEAHPNGVFRIDHLVIRTSSTPRTVAAIEALGAGRRGGRNTNSAGEAVDMTFFWAGDTLLELAGPPVPVPDGPPARLAGLAFATEDLDGVAARLGGRLTTPVDAVQPGRRIAALTPAAGSTVPVAFMTPHVRD
ncbi:MAG: glyoxalase [Acidimicrobiales bacterium]